MTAYRTEFFSMNDVNRLRTLQTLSTDASQHALLPAGWRSQADTAVVCSNAAAHTG